MPLTPSDEFEELLRQALTVAIDAWEDDPSDLRDEAAVIIGVLRDPFNRQLVNSLVMYGSSHPHQLATPIPQPAR